MFLANLRVTIMQEVDHSGFNCMASNKVIESMICDDCVQGVIKNMIFQNASKAKIILPGNL